jgi:O-6-methylguanine DNA methyltransferase
VSAADQHPIASPGCAGLTAPRELEEYLAGARRRCDLPLDLRLATGFRRAVLSQLPGIGYGHTASYAAVAAAAGSPRAVRAVGTACATNPLPIIVPCHRVIRSDGSPGRYLGGAAAKQLLLTWRQCELDNDSREGGRRGRGRRGNCGTHSSRSCPNRSRDCGGNRADQALQLLARPTRPTRAGCRRDHRRRRRDGPDFI